MDQELIAGLSSMFSFNNYFWVCLQGVWQQDFPFEFKKWVFTPKIRFSISGIELVICSGYTHFQGRCDFFLLCSTFWNMIILSASLGYAWLSSIRWHKSAIRMNNTNIVFSFKTFFLFNWQYYGIHKQLWTRYWYSNFCLIRTQIP